MVAMNTTTQKPADTLRAESAASRLSFEKFGVRRALTDAQKAEAADVFSTNPKALSASKRLFDTTNPRWRAVTCIFSQAKAIWRNHTLPFPEPGVRLLRKNNIPKLEEELAKLKAQLHDAVAALDEDYDTIRAQAREQLGQLFNEADYPGSLAGQFCMSWDYPAVEVPSYLAELSPELYERERQRVAAQFDEAVRLAEQAFTDEFAKLVENLGERLTPDEQGKPKMLRTSTVENLRDFFTKFESMSLRSNPGLDDLVTKAKNLMEGRSAQDLRDNDALRATMKAQMDALSSAIQTEAMPTRRIRMSGGIGVAGPAASAPVSEATPAGEPVPAVTA